MSRFKLQLSLGEYQIALNDNYGFCTACGYEQGGMEPDAENYECEICGKEKVQGADVLLLQGYVT